MKIGKIRISDTLIKERPNDALFAFKYALPIYIEIRPHMRDYVYTCISDSFDEIKEGDEIPVYDCIVTTGSGDSVAVKYERI